MAIKLKKAKISKSGCLEASYIDEDGNKVSLEGKYPVHIDLKVRLKQLVRKHDDGTYSFNKKGNGIKGEIVEYRHFL